MLEVVVSLAIISLVLGAAFRASSVVTDGSHQLRHRLLGLWVVQNRLEEKRALLEWPPPGEESGETDMDGINFIWKETVSDTDNPLFRKIVLKAFLDEKSEYPVAELVGYLDHNEK